EASDRSSLSSFPKERRGDIRPLHGSNSNSAGTKVVADAISSSSTDRQAACTWCTYSPAAVSREARARDRPRWRAPVRCASSVALPAGAKARADDQHRTVPARPAEARRAPSFEGGGRAAVAPDGEARPALPRLPRVDLRPSLLGQNVGTGPTVRAVFRAFMRSADHRANVLDRSYRRAGYGVVKFRG